MESHNRRLPIRRGLAKSIMAERNPSVLLVEDEPFVQTLLAAYLEKEGVAVTVASTAAEMRAALRSPAQPIDAIALDLGLPDEEGLALVRQLRTRLDVPICITTQDDSEASRSVAAQLGVDDYLVKPFHPRQLIASLMALLGRDSDRQTTIRFEGWSFDSAAKGRTVSRAHLLDAIASDSGASSRVVDVIVSGLRRKLGDPARAPRLVVTVPGVGYRFCASSE